MWKYIHIVQWFYSMQLPGSLTNSVRWIILAIDSFRFSIIIVNHIIWNQRSFSQYLWLLLYLSYHAIHYLESLTQYWVKELIFPCTYNTSNFHQLEKNFTAIFFLSNLSVYKSCCFSHLVSFSFRKIVNITSKKREREKEKALRNE